jgi:hypothetical protein
VKELRNLGRPLNDLFREVYCIPELDLRPQRLNGNCPVTRKSGTVQFSTGIPPEVVVLPGLELNLSPDFIARMADCRDAQGRYWIEFDAIPKDSLRKRSAIRDLNSFLRFLVAAGLLHIASNDNIFPLIDWKMLRNDSPHNFLMYSDVSQSTSQTLRVPRMSILDLACSAHTLTEIMQIDAPGHFILFPRVAFDPRHNTRRLVDVVPHLSIPDVLSRMQS